MLDYARRIFRAEDADAAVAAFAALNDDESISAYDKRQIIALALYGIEYDAHQRDKRSRRSRRANALLREFLTTEQQDELRRTSHFHVRGSLGNLYRLTPKTGMVWRMEQRGKSWRYIAAYCLHDYAEDDPSFRPTGLPGEGSRSQVPSADTSLGHMLLLRSDEAEFRRQANERASYGRSLWHAEWGFRLRAERRQLGLQLEPAA